MKKIIIITSSSLLVLGLLFLSFIYYLGKTATVNEVLVNGQWIEYKDYGTGDLGEVVLYDQPVYAGPEFLVAGEALDEWFYEGQAGARVIGASGQVLWQGAAYIDEHIGYNIPMTFYAEVEVDDYVGEATFVLIQAYEDENAEEYTFSLPISIVGSFESE